MMKHIKDAIKKFRQDALSKLIYDVLKWLIPASILFAFTILVPEGTSLFTVFSKAFTVSLYWILLYSLIIIILTVVVVNIIYRKKYLEIQIDNFTNELTGLKNHKALKKYLVEQLHDLDKNSQKTLSIIIIDVDDFKQFNTTYGFSVADQILKKLGELLGNDKRVTDETFRYFNRGDEFLVITNDTSSVDAFRAAERKRKHIQNTSFEVNNQVYTLTVSCGVKEYKRDDTFSSLTGRAISALNEAKKANKTILGLLLKYIEK